MSSSQAPSFKQSLCAKSIVALLACFIATPAQSQTEEEISYTQHVAPILTKYCAGCHNDSDQEGDFSLSTLEALNKGTPDGAVLVAGEPSGSKLLQLMTGTEPQMPPEDEPQPKSEDIELVRAWIANGMPVGSKSAMPETRGFEAADPKNQYVHAAETVADKLIFGRLGSIQARGLKRQKKTSWQLDNLGGKINSLRVSPDNKTIVVGGGIAAVEGEISLVDAANGTLLRKLKGHSDSVYCATLSPDGKLIASGSYDRTVIIWDAASGDKVHSLTGHNGAIYDLDFDPTGTVLATASADQTVKLWNVRTGERLDTLGQPEGEMYCVRFSANGSSVFAAGADKQIRKWKLSSKDRPAINPMLVARYAHESEILQLRLLGDNRLISGSSDRSVKLWSTKKLEPIGSIAKLEDVPVAICVPDAGKLASVIVDLKGRTTNVAKKAITKLRVASPEKVVSADPESTTTAAGNSDITKLAESEPNDQFADGVKVDAPIAISGTINFEQGADEKEGSLEDVDLFRFSAAEGENWIIEAKAAKDSPVDSLIDVLDEYGNPVLRTRLQAVRETYFTFRGKDSNTSDDFRLHKWEDMSLDEYLYSNGEVTRLWLYPRGPDSGFKVYPGFGNRYTFFDTTPLTHALGEPAFIVRELSPNEDPLPNGLPVFPIYYQNDDDPLRRGGKDSRLSFKAPASGEYFVRIRDARGFSGDDFKYSLTIRRPKPDFSISVSTKELQIPKGSGREWKITAKRIDGLSGPISVSIENLPAGFIATNPVIIEAGQETGLGSIYATSEATLPTSTSESPQDENVSDPASLELQLVARSVSNGSEIEQELEQTIKLSLSETKEVQIRLYPTASQDEELTELTIQPGQTISARVAVERNGTKSRIGFGKEDSGRNLPHGAYVDNIGLNGLLITEQLNEREFFITADRKVEPGRRQFHLRSDTKGNPTSRPIWLNVVP